jgi:hypothetical protein
LNTNLCQIGSHPQTRRNGCSHDTGNIESKVEVATLTLVTFDVFRTISHLFDGNFLQIMYGVWLHNSVSTKSNFF